MLNLVGAAKALRCVKNFCNFVFLIYAYSCFANDYLFRICETQDATDMKYSLTHILTSLTTPVVATAFFAMAATAPALALAAAPTLSAIEAAPAGLNIEGETAIVSGKIDVRDLISLKEQSQAPVTLDLRQADIEEYMAAKPVYAGRRFFTRNALPAYIFFQAPYNNVLLPENVKTIEAGACADSQLYSPRRCVS